MSVDRVGYKIVPTGKLHLTILYSASDSFAILALYKFIYLLTYTVCVSLNDCSERVSISSILFMVLASICMHYYCDVVGDAGLRNTC